MKTNKVYYWLLIQLSVFLFVGCSGEEKTGTILEIDNYIKVVSILLLIVVILYLIGFCIELEAKKIKKEEDLKNKRLEEKRRKQQKFNTEFFQRFNSYGNKTVDIILGSEEFDINNHFLVFEETEVIVLNGEEIPFLKIVSYNLHDNSELIATSSSYDSKTSTSTGSMLGRAVIGGTLLGPIGALAGASTAEKKTTYQGTTTRTTTIHKFVLYVNIDDLNNPTRKLFIGMDAEKANNITNIFNIIIKRNKERT